MANYCSLLNKTCDLLSNDGKCPNCNPVEGIYWEQDATGAALCPGRPELCEGNGKHEKYECCCDECNYFLKCFPECDVAIAEVIKNK